MTQDGATLRSGRRRLAIVSLVLVALAVYVPLLWRWFDSQDSPQDSSAVAAPKQDRAAGPSSSPPPREPPRGEGTRERSQSVEDRSRPDGASRAVRELEDRPRRGERDPSPPATVGMGAIVRPSEPLAPIPLVGVDSPSRSAPAAAAAVSAGGSASVVPRAPDPGAAGPAVPSSGEVGTRSESPAESPGEESQTEATTPFDGEPGSDHTPPVLQALRFDPPVVEGGNLTMLTVQASDDLSGLKSVRGEIRSPNGLALLPFGSGDVGSGDVRTFAITIPREAESGVWYVSWISLTDGAANPLLLQARSPVAAPSGGTVTVNSPESDSTPPEVLQVWFDKTTVAGGEKNTIRVDTRDEGSGVGSIMGACRSPSKSALIWFECALNAGSGSWEGDIPIPANAECGEWGISQLAVKDKAGNTNLLMGDSVLLARAGFRVAFRADCDSTPPTLEAFELSPTIVSSETATEILVTAMVHDEESGAVKMTGWFEGPTSSGGQVPKNYFQCSPNPNDPEAPWTGRILVPQHAAKGTWKVGVIRLQDKALNFREYIAVDPEVSGRIFEVQ